MQANVQLRDVVAILLQCAYGSKVIPSERGTKDLLFGGPWTMHLALHRRPQLMSRHTWPMAWRGRGADCSAPAAVSLQL